MHAIKVENLNYTYGKKSPFEKQALKNVSLEINEGEFFGIIGETGSGKSTLVSHFNALSKIQQGNLSVFDLDASKKKSWKKLRSTVGMVFQYPEYQLFEDTVFKDVAFGPKNMKLEKDEIEKRVKNAILAVGLDYEKIKDKSPFEISGGQKRRVAIAGVISMQPKILVLDEPTAGLDPQGRDEILSLVKSLQKSVCPTIIMVSHNMDEISSLADRILVMNKGTAEKAMAPKDLFAQKEIIENSGLDFPTATKIQHKLEKRGIKFESCAVTVEDLAKQIGSMGGQNA